MSTSDNDNLIGGAELLTHLQQPTDEVKGIADAILAGISENVRAPLAIAALTFALAEAIIANTSPAEQWGRTIGQRLDELVRAGALLPPN